GSRSRPARGCEPVLDLAQVYVEDREVGHGLLDRAFQVRAGGERGDAQPVLAEEFGHHLALKCLVLDQHDFQWTAQGNHTPHPPRRIITEPARMTRWGDFRRRYPRWPTYF